MNKRSTRIGRTAETQVKLWLESAGAVVSPPGHDCKGWDFFVDLPEDIGGPASKCLIQVKATDNERRRCDVALASWYHLVHAPMPSFFVVLEYSRCNDPQRVYVVHVWHDIVAKVLRRRRREELARQISRRRPVLGLTWDRTNMVLPEYGCGLTRVIREHIGIDPFAYINAKERLLKSVGYSEHPYRGTITISGVSHDQICRRLAEHAIGLTDVLDMAQVEIQEDRFGLLAPVSTEPQSELSHLALTPTPGRCTIRMTNHVGSRAAQENCEFYSAAAVFPFLPKAYRIVRVVSKALELLIDPGDSRMRISVDFPEDNTTLTVRESRNAAVMFRIMKEQKEHGIEVEIMVDGSSWPIKMDCNNIEADYDVDVSLLEAIENCWELCRHFEVPEDEPIDIQRVYSSAAKLKLMRLLLASPVENATFRGTLLEAPSADRVDAVVVFPIYYRVGRYGLLAVCTVRGVAQLTAPEAACDGGTFVIEGGVASVCKKHAIINTSGVNLERAISEHIECIAARLDQEGGPVVIKMPPNFANG